MRVLMVGNYFPPAHLGGYELVCAEAAMELAQQGHDVSVLVSDRALDGEASDTPFPVHRRLRLYWRDGWYPRLSFRERYEIERHNHRALSDALTAHRPQLVAWWNMSGISLGLLEHVGRRGVSSLAMVCDWWPRGAPELDRWSATWRRHPRAAPLAAAVLGVPTRFDVRAVSRWMFASRYLRDELRRDALAGVDGPVVPLGYDSELFGETPRGPWRRRLLYVGRVSAEKGVDIALRALADLGDRYDLSVLGGGDDEERDKLAALASELGVEGSVHWLGPRPRTELPGHLAQADALLFPIRWAEPWGLVPLEAMACGLPIVAVVAGGAAEYMEPERNVLAVPSEDPAAVAQAVRRLADDGILRAQLRDGGLRTARNHDAASFNRDFIRQCEAVAAAR